MCLPLWLNIAMRIDEIFDNPYEWHWEDMRGMTHKMFAMKTAAIGLGDVVTAMKPVRPSRFSASSGRMAATFKVDEDTIWVMFERGRPGHWFVTFDSQENRLGKDKTYSNTGGGHAGKILATVIDIVKDFMVHYEPEVLHFTARDRKRASVYKAIVNKIGSYNKYKADIEKHGAEGEQFSLSR